MRYGWSQRANSALRTGYKLYKGGKFAYDAYNRIVQRVPKRPRANSDPGPAPPSKKRSYQRTGKAMTSYVPRRGPSGPYAGRFKKYKKRRIIRKNKYKKISLRNAFVYKLERGSVETASNNHTVYLGHGVACQTLWQCAITNLVKNLFTKAGIDISNMSDPIRLALQRNLDSTIDRVRISFTFKDDPQNINFSNGSVDLDTAAAGNFSFSYLAADLRIDIAATVATTVADFGEIIFGSFKLYFISNLSSEANIIPVASIDMETYHVDMSVYSSMVIQNRSLNASGTSSTDVNNANPVVGKHYMSNKKWCNGFDLYRSTITTLGATNIPLYTDSFTGIIATSSDATQPEILQKPPPPYVLGVKNSTSVLMQPGAIKKLTLNWKCSMKFNTLAQKLNKCVDATGITGPAKFEIGFAEMVAIEQFLNDRTVVVPVVLGWELNQTYTVAGRYKRPKTVPFIDVI